MSRTRTIAIVDDDDGVRAALAGLVRSLGYEVRSYGSATDFLEDETVGDPDCLIADIQMPRMRGDQLQAQLVAAGRRFPMIFMTAFPTEAIRARVMTAGAACFLEKPVDGATIARWLTVLVPRATGCG
jgi:FixJ family two-component response regulator